VVRVPELFKGLEGVRLERHSHTNRACTQSNAQHEVII